MNREGYRISVQGLSLGGEQIGLNLKGCLKIRDSRYLKGSIRITYMRAPPTRLVNPNLFEAKTDCNKTGILRSAEVFSLHVQNS
jgi:hypothetical protein